MIKTVEKKGKVQHLLDLSLQTSLKWKESGEKLKKIYKAFCQHCDFIQL